MKYDHSYKIMLPFEVAIGTRNQDTENKSLADESPIKVLHAPLDQNTLRYISN